VSPFFHLIGEQPPTANLHPNARSRPWQGLAPAITPCLCKGRGYLPPGAPNDANLVQTARFPPTVIQHAVWLYFRFTLSLRDVEEMLAVTPPVNRQRASLEKAPSYQGHSRPEWRSVYPPNFQSCRIIAALSGKARVVEAFQFGRIECSECRTRIDWQHALRQPVALASSNEQCSAARLKSEIT